MRALEIHLPRLVNALHEEKIRFNHIGSVGRLSSRAQEVLKWANYLTKANGPKPFNLAFNYGGREDIMHSLRMIVAQKIPPDMITEAVIDKYLYTGNQSDVDLLIRSGGEKRVSNFMLWQIETAYIYFTDIYWPNIGESEISDAIKQFHNSELRRTRAFNGSQKTCAR